MQQRKKSNGQSGTVWYRLLLIFLILFSAFGIYRSIAENNTALIVVYAIILTASVAMLIRILGLYRLNKYKQKTKLQNRKTTGKKAVAKVQKLNNLKKKPQNKSKK